MPDDLSNRGKADRDRINTNEEHELRFWTEKFGCTTEQLVDAVKRVGSMATDVRKALRKT